MVCLGARDEKEVISILAGEERIELSITVLETAVIPLNYSPKNDKE